ncbi:CvpA family protein [Brucepastera parasyntrophica]|uniref:CvpA family protein n=1 Tax=Brucepastera parasyntrophica TaxID=2880008 RepID=UPI002109D1E9|nr:CvpA family protein [Brucepastera parasyntrophica]ULQ59817.1 CvpA family protein [Brucepastera parasyntrophica]
MKADFFSFFSVFDLVLLIIIIIMIIKVTISGFIQEFFSKAAVIIGAIGAIIFYKPLTPVVIKITGTNTLAEIVAFLVIFLVLYIVIKILQRIMHAVFRGESMTNLDRALGFFLGLVEGLLIVTVLLLLIRVQPWFDLSFITDGSLFVRLLDPLLAEAAFKVPDILL